MKCSCRHPSWTTRHSSLTSKNSSEGRLPMKLSRCFWIQFWLTKTAKRALHLAKQTSITRCSHQRTIWLRYHSPWKSISLHSSESLSNRRQTSCSKPKTWSKRRTSTTISLWSMSSKASARAKVSSMMPWDPILSNQACKSLVKDYQELKAWKSKLEVSSIRPQSRTKILKIEQSLRLLGHHLASLIKSLQ